MTSSGTSTASWKQTSLSTHDTFPAKKIQQTVHPEGSTTIAPSSSQQSPYPYSSDNMYVTSMHLSYQLSHALYNKGKPQHPSQDLIMCHSNKNVQQLTPHSNGMPGPPSPRHRGGSIGKHFSHTVQYTPKAGKPAWYTKDLCPLLSTRHLHVLASDADENISPVENPIFAIFN